jgi:hypothetical protein
MASFVYQRFKERIAEAAVNFASADFRVLLAMTNTTADTEKNANAISGFTTLDECNGSGYARVDLAGVARVRDDGNAIVYLDASDAVFTSLGPGTRQNQGAVLFIFVTADSDHIPAAWIDSGGFPFDGTGSNNTIQWNALGIVQLTG